MSMLFAYMAGGERGRGLELLKCLSEGGQNFFYLLCGCGGVWSGSGPLLP